MTTEKLTELRRLAEAAKANLDQPYYSAKCVECGFELSHRHSYGCSVPEDSFKKEANPATILELLNTLDRAMEVIKFYGNRENWKFESYKNDVKDSIKFDDIGCKSYNETPDFACGSGGRRAREFLASLEGGGK